MPSSKFDYTLLDERARPAIIAAHRDAPSDEALQKAALVEYEPSPAMLEQTARWIRIRGELADAGLTPAEILRVFLRAEAHVYDVLGPGNAMLALVFTDVSDVVIAHDVCEHLLSLEEIPYHVKDVGTIAMARIAADGELDPRFDRLLEWGHVHVPVIRALLAALPLERREALVLSKSTPIVGLGGIAISAAFILDMLLTVRDLVDTPAIAVVRASLIAAVRASPITAGDPRVEALIAEEAGGTPRPVHPRPTPDAQQALQYLADKRKAERRAAELGPLAERVHSQRAIVVDAPELASVPAWAAAGEQRQQEIAEAVVAALGPDFSLVGLQRFGGPPIAVLSHEDKRFCIVPGGTFEIGFSPDEEAEVRLADERNAGCGDHNELYDSLELMRPLTRVAVGPMVVAQEQGTAIPPQDATDELELSPLRLPSEAEWEYLARGGRHRELTYRGAEVPDSEEWFEATYKLGIDGANAFGLWGFGFEPEACADVFHPGHDDIPTDGSPRRGDGPRVVKGGAAQVYPWQACGEWQLLLSAMRTPQTSWKFALSLRLVIGIQIAP
jgi:hypothetical protein